MWLYIDRHFEFGRLSWPELARNQSTEDLIAGLSDSLMVRQTHGSDILMAGLPDERTD